MPPTTVTLYKRATTGKAIQWSIELNKDSYRITSGQVGGKLVTSNWTEAQPMNVGKANYRNEFDQALSEVNAKIILMKKEGYRDTIEEAMEHDRFEPMLAYDLEEKYEKFVNELPFMYSQPKLDGVRAYTTKDGQFSRKHNRSVSAPHIFQILKGLFEYFPDMVIDGELYAHKFKNDFDKIISLAKKTVPTAADLEESAELLEYHIYDIFFPREPDMLYEERLAYMENLIGGIGESNPKTAGKIKIIKTIKVNPRNKNLLARIHDRYVELGYEGQMLRAEQPYQQKRTKFLLKDKRLIEKEFEIVRLLEGKGNRSGMVGMVEVRLNDGQLCKAGMSGNVELYKKMWIEKDEYPGKLATIQFQGYTPKKSLRFPTFKAVRDYE